MSEGMRLETIKALREAFDAIETQFYAMENGRGDRWIDETRKTLAGARVALDEEAMAKYGTSKTNASAGNTNSVAQ